MQSTTETRSDVEAVAWLMRLTELANAQDPTDARRVVKDRLIRWATRSARNLQSFLEVALLFEALGECDQEMMNEMVAIIDPGSNCPVLELRPRRPGE